MRLTLRAKILAAILIPVVATDLLAVWVVNDRILAGRRDPDRRPLVPEPPVVQHLRHDPARGAGYRHLPTQGVALGAGVRTTPRR